jgi:hypothetical protein
MKPKLWDRKLWGIEFRGSLKDDRPRLIGAGWLDSAHLVSYYQGEPTRALLFTTRTEARAFCDVQHAKYIGRTDCCAKWRFRPVRVRETVRVVP